MLDAPYYLWRLWKTAGEGHLDIFRLTRARSPGASDLYRSAYRWVLLVLIERYRSYISLGKISFTLLRYEELDLREQRLPKKTRVGRSFHYRGSHYCDPKTL